MKNILNFSNKTELAGLRTKTIQVVLCGWKPKFTLVQICQVE